LETTNVDTRFQNKTDKNTFLTQKLKQKTLIEKLDPLLIIAGKY
jgi:hypothetical protein